MPRLRRRHLFFGLFAAMTISCLGPDVDKNYARVHSDSGIMGRPYTQIVAELKDLEAKYPTVAKVITYGRSVQGRDLTMIRIMKPGNYVRRRGVVIEGSIHGDEFLNIEDRLPRWFLEHQDSPGVSRFLEAGGIIWISPILNPDGYSARRRANNRGQDLNRDFSVRLANKVGFTQPETTSLAKTIESEVAVNGATIGLTLDYHCCVGAVLYPWGHSYSKELPVGQKREHLRLGKIILDEFPGYEIGRAIEVVQYVAIGAADDFYHESFQATSFTFEGVQYREGQNFAAHTRMWDRLLATQVPEGTVPDSQQNREQAPKLAILGQGAKPSDLMIAISGPPGTSRVAICRGNVADCSPQSSLVNFQAPYDAGGRLVFNALTPLSIQSEGVFTLHAFNDSPGSSASPPPWGRAVIKLRPR